MGWRDKLREGSFRGVKFKVDATDDTAGGRRTVGHTYPGRDKPYIEDMGQKHNDFRVDAYLVGPDYMEARDALLEATTEPGPGELVHPYLGTKQVVCTGCKLRHTQSEGGMVRVSLSFEETGERRFPKASADQASALDGAAKATQDAAQDSFSDGFDVAGFPQFVADSATGLVGGLSDKLGEITGGLSGIPGAVASFSASVSKLKSDAKNLIDSPSKLAGRISAAFGQLTDAYGKSPDTVSALNKAAEFGDDVPAIQETTSTRQQQSANQKALFDLVKSVALSESVRHASAVEFESRAAAEATRDNLVNRLDDRMENTDSDAEFLALQDLRARLSLSVPSENERLPVLLEYTPPVSTPALVVAYSIYGDATRADEIAARNEIKHPGFVPGGAPVEVLSE